jgi:hypothetical protein
MDEKTTHMVFATAAVAAVAAVLAGSAGAVIPEGNGVQPVGTRTDARQSLSSGAVVVPYLSQGIGVDKTQFSGTASRTLAGPATAQQGLDMAIRTAIAARSERTDRVTGQTIPYLSQGIGVDASQFSGQASPQPAAVHATPATPLPHGIQVVLSPPSEPQSLGLTGDSALTRISAPEPEGLTGDSALTRVPESAPTPTASGGSELDWTSFGAGAGMVALLAAGLVGVVLATRRRHTVGLP